MDAAAGSPDVRAVSCRRSPATIYEHRRAPWQARPRRRTWLMVVMPDADLDQAVDALIGAARPAGERCMAIIGVLVGREDVADRIMPRLVERTWR